MLRSMYAGVSGLKSHQTKMDVIGNNISNVNTTGYKGSRVTFKEMLNQTIGNAQAPQDNGRGGMNPQQIGLGVDIGSIDVDQSQGNLQSTGKNTDLAIEGNGYFVVDDGNQQLYTRAGSLSLDSNGNLISSATGLKIQGWSADSGEIDTDQDTGDIKIPMGKNMDAKKTTEVGFSGNLDSRVDNGVAKTSSIGVYDSLGNKHTVNVDFTRRITTELIGEVDITGSSDMLKVDQMTADPNMDGFEIEFAQDEDEKFKLDYSGEKLTVYSDWNENDVGPTDKSLDEIQQAINNELNENGLTGALELDYGGDLVSDLNENAGKSITLNQPEVTFDGTDYNLLAEQDTDNPDPALNDLSIKFEQADASSLTGTYNEGDHEIVLAADWENSGTGSPPSEFGDIEDEINEVLTNNNFDGQITLDALDNDNLIVDISNSTGNGDYAATSPNYTTLTDLGSLKISASNSWDWESTDITDAVDGTDDGDTEPLFGNGTIVFDGNGQIISGGQGSITFDPIADSSKNPEAEQTVTINFDSDEGSLSQFATGSSVEGAYADGYESGNLNSFSINDTGVITGQYSNGVNQDLGQIGIASFSNPNGLTKEGDSMFAESKNSGIAQIGTAGNGGRGSIIGGSLEMSNVDLAKEFTEMITSQRGYQSSSKVITTSDEMLQTLVNLKR